MTSISKLLAFVMFAASAATISALSPSDAQAGRTAVILPEVAPRPDCCVPATKPVVTGAAGWTVKPPNAQPTTAAIVAPTHQLWNTIPGSKWIGPAANAGSTGAGGLYVYTYHLGCLCDLPKGVDVAPAFLSFNVYADDSFTARLNGNVIAQKLTGWSFRSGPPAPSNAAAPPGGVHVTAPPKYFNTGCKDNVLTIEVINGSAGPTGLDVYGSMSGYFRTGPCPCGPRDSTENPN